MSYPMRPWQGNGDVLRFRVDLTYLSLSQDVRSGGNLLMFHPIFLRS